MLMQKALRSVEITVNDPSALLVFSGGQTRTLAQETEGDSYFRLAEALDLYRQYAVPKTPGSAEGSATEVSQGNQRQPAEMMDVSKAVEEGHPQEQTVNKPQVAPHDIAPYARATTEQFALDSYQNLIFSISRFKE